jgi:hypothetical protein
LNYRVLFFNRRVEENLKEFYRTTLRFFASLRLNTLHVENYFTT